MESVCTSSAKDPDWACRESHEVKMKMCACYHRMMFMLRGREMGKSEFQQSLPTNEFEGGENDYE